MADLSARNIGAPNGGQSNRLACEFCIPTTSCVCSGNEARTCLACSVAIDGRLFMPEARSAWPLLTHILHYVTISIAVWVDSPWGERHLSTRTKIFFLTISLPTDIAGWWRESPWQPGIPDFLYHLARGAGAELEAKLGFDLRHRFHPLFGSRARRVGTLTPDRLGLIFQGFLIEQTTFDLVIATHIVATAHNISTDIGISDAVVWCGAEMPPEKKRIEPRRWVLPGGVDAHCIRRNRQIDGSASRMILHGTRSAGCGGTTTVIAVRAEKKARRWSSVDDYHADPTVEACVD